MKAVVPLLFFIFSLCRLSAQAPPVDSLKAVLAATRSDTVKVNVLCDLSFYNQSFQQGLELAEQGLKLAKEIDYKKGEAACLRQIGNQYWTVSNYPMALHFYLEALKIREAIGDRSGMASSYASVGYIYKETGDYRSALSYLRKAEAMHITDNYKSAILYAEFGDVFSLINEMDSALKYYQMSYVYFNLGDDNYQMNIALNGLGTAQLAAGNTELALGYFQKSISNGFAYDDTLGLSDTYIRMARLFDATGSRDSSIWYARQALYFSQRVNSLQNIIASGRLLSKLNQENDDKEALRYLQIAQEANDSLFSRERTMEMQNMFYNEREREAEQQQHIEREKEERRLNIQYACIALAIVIFIILFLFLSGGFITNAKVIEFFGVLGLLLVFEFINLLIRPWLSSLTDNSPVLMLVVLVALASMLIPLHNRLQKWIQVKLVARNKKVRLGKARRTIEKLENENYNSSDISH